MNEQKRPRYDAEYKKNRVALANAQGRSVSEVEQ